MSNSQSPEDETVDDKPEASPQGTETDARLIIQFEDNTGGEYTEREYQYYRQPADLDEDDGGGTYVGDENQLDQASDDDRA